MSAATFLKSSLFAKQLYTCSKMSQASIKISITTLDKLDNFVNIDTTHDTIEESFKKIVNYVKEV